MSSRDANMKPDSVGKQVSPGQAFVTAREQRPRFLRLTIGVLSTILATPRLVFGLGGIFTNGKVVEHFSDNNLVILDAGRNQGVSLGDSAVLLSDSEIAGTGTVFYLEAGRCGVRVNEDDARSLKAAAAVVVSRSLPAVCRVALPPGVTVWADVDEIAPGHRTAWLRQGRHAGLRLNDGLWISRSDGPIAKATVIDLLDDAALIEFVPMAPGWTVRPGDRARLWPSPSERREGRIALPVLRVESQGAAQHVWFTGGAADGLTIDRMVELLRNGVYVATAIVDQPGGPMTRATTIEAYIREPVQKGDEAVLMGLAGEGEALAGRIFRIEGNYCLVSIGENSGVRRDQPLYVVRDRQIVATLKVKAIKEGYCGAEAQRPSTGVPRLWDQVLSQPPDHRVDEAVGKIARLSSDAQFAMVQATAKIVNAESGTILQIAQDSGPLGAGIVVHKDRSRIVLYIPPCWHNLPISSGAQAIHFREVALPEK